MLHCHKQCPICGGELASYKATSLRVIERVSLKKSIFIEWICSMESSTSGHMFAQTSSLEGELLLEEIFWLNGIAVEVNYSKQNSTITFFGKSDFPIREFILDKILELDYPNLENVHKKIKNMALLL